MTLVGGPAVAATPTAAAQAPGGLVSPTRLLGVTPPRTDGEGEVTLRYRVSGSPLGHGTTRLEVDALAPDRKGEVAPYGRASVSITSVAIESPAMLEPQPRPQPALVPACARGHAPSFNGGRSFVMHVPANTSPLLTITAQVPRGVRGSFAGVAVEAQLLSVPGFATPAVALPPVLTPLKRSGLRPAVELRQRAVAGGRVRLSGKVRGVKTGTRVGFAGVSVPAGAGASGADSALGSDAQAFAPLGDGLRRLGTTRTTRGGSFAATLKIPANTAVLARTGGSLPGASCPLLVAK